MSSRKPDLAKLSPETRLVAAGREYTEHGFVNPAVYHASTVLFPDAETLRSHNQEYKYGRRGTPTSRSVESAIALLEGGYATKMTPSGLAAITTVLLSFLKAGDHLLMTDTCYEPARLFCDTLLKGYGVETTYFEATVGAGIVDLIRPTTRLIYCESPGSQTMEVQDIPAICEAAHKRSCLVAIDNTWSAGHYFKAFDYGVDISLQAATKYLVGHSDAMMGCVTCSKDTWEHFRESYESMGQFAGPDDMYMTLRGIRTLDVRLERHMKNGLQVAEWLRGRPEVATVLYPALSNAPGHEIWKRDFRGASSLFSIILKPCSQTAVNALLDGLTLFGMGSSWGGFESLCVPFRPKRTAAKWVTDGPCLRLHVGLESPADLIDDLNQAFARLNGAG